MREDFARTLSLLRQYKGVSQRKAAAELGVSQALLSHYENGIREPGLNFVTRACDYYNVSADFMLGRTLSRDGAIIVSEELYDASQEKGSLKGSIMATLQKKLVVNTACLLFDVLGAMGDRAAITAAGSYLSDALYQLLRLLYRAAGGNESYFSTPANTTDKGSVEADMCLSRAKYTDALEAFEGEFPNMSDQVLAEKYPGLAQSMAQVLHGTDERVSDLTK